MWCNFVVILLFLVLYIHISTHLQKNGDSVLELQKQITDVQKQITADMQRLAMEAQQQGGDGLPDTRNGLLKRRESLRDLATKISSCPTRITTEHLTRAKALGVSLPKNRRKKDALAVLGQAHTVLLTEILGRWRDDMNPNTHQKDFKYETQGRGIRKMQPKMYYADDSLNVISTYILSCIGKLPADATLSPNGKGRKVLLIKGAMGKGKTRLCVELCKGDLLQSDLEHPVTFVRVTGNEGFEPVINKQELVEVRFAKALLQFHGIDAGDLQHVASLEDVDYLMREKLVAVGAMKADETGTKQVMVVCVDELLELLIQSDACDLVRELIKYQENTLQGEKPTLFMFTTLTTKRGNELTIPSGRKPYYYAVPTVPEDKLQAVAASLVPNFDDLYDRSAAFRQLFHIGLHNPRYIIEGFCALDFEADQQVDKANLDFQKLFEKAVEGSGLSDVTIADDIVKNWISSSEGIDSETTIDLQERNLVYRDAEDKLCLSPILLRQWALQNSTRNLGAAMNKVFLADRAVQLGEGAPMESVIMNLEVAARIASKKQALQLCEWFPGGIIKYDCRYLKATAKCVPVEQMPQGKFLKDIPDQVEHALLMGQHVNPGHNREPAIDYLAPLWMNGDERPTILAYQHKNRKQLRENNEKERDAYIRVVRKILEADIVKTLSGKKYRILPVLFTTTHANDTIRNEVTGEPAAELVRELDKLCPEGWVVFDYKGMWQFTHRLGCMRPLILKPYPALATEGKKENKEKEGKNKNVRFSTGCWHHVLCGVQRPLAFHAFPTACGPHIYHHSRLG